MLELPPLTYVLLCLRNVFGCSHSTNYQIALGNVYTSRDGKGKEDRITMLPEQLIESLKQQLDYAKSLHSLDLAEGLGDVELPFDG